MTKTKMSTVAIVTLSVLLAAALAATIVLAAFAFSGKATTTITFAGGIELTASGINNDGTWTAYNVSTTGVKGAEISGNENLTNGVALSNISITNNSKKTVKVAVAVVIENASSSATAPDFFVSSKSGADSTNALSAETTDKLVQSTVATGLNFGTGTLLAKDATSIGVKAWLVYDIEASKAANVTSIINTAFAQSAVEGFTGKGFTANFYVAAGYDDEGLSQAITTGAYETFTQK